MNKSSSSSSNVSSTSISSSSFSSESFSSLATLSSSLTVSTRYLDLDTVVAPIDSENLPRVTFSANFSYRSVGSSVKDIPARTDAFSYEGGCTIWSSTCSGVLSMSHACSIHWLIRRCSRSLIVMEAAKAESSSISDKTIRFLSFSLVMFPDQSSILSSFLA